MHKQLTENPRNFDAVGGQVELGVVVALVIVAEAVSAVAFAGEALLPVVGVGRSEGVFAAGVAALHRVADEAADALCNCRMNEPLQTSCFHAEGWPCFLLSSINLPRMSILYLLQT